MNTFVKLFKKINVHINVECYRKKLFLSHINVASAVVVFSSKGRVFHMWAKMPTKGVKGKLHQTKFVYSFCTIQVYLLSI